MNIYCPLDCRKNNPRVKLYAVREKCQVIYKWRPTGGWIDLTRTENYHLRTLYSFICYRFFGILWHTAVNWTNRAHCSTLCASCIRVYLLVLELPLRNGKVELSESLYSQVWRLIIPQNNEYSFACDYLSIASFKVRELPAMLGEFPGVGTSSQIGWVP